MEQTDAVSVDFPVKYRAYTSAGYYIEIEGAGTTPLQYAVYSGAKWLVYVLLKHGADPHSVQAMTNDTPLKICLNSYLMHKFTENEARYGDIAIQLLHYGAPADDIDFSIPGAKRFKTIVKNSVLSRYTSDAVKLSILNEIFAGTTGDEQQETEIGKFFRKQTGKKPVSVDRISNYRDLHQEWLRLKPQSKELQAEDWDLVAAQETLSSGTADSAAPGHNYRDDHIMECHRSDRAESLHEEAETYEMRDVRSPLFLTTRLGARPDAPAAPAHEKKKTLGWLNKFFSSGSSASPAPSSPSSAGRDPG